MEREAALAVLGEEVEVVTQSNERTGTRTEDARGVLMSARSWRLGGSERGSEDDERDRKGEAGMPGRTSARAMELISSPGAREGTGRKHGDDRECLGE